MLSKRRIDGNLLVRTTLNGRMPVFLFDDHCGCIAGSLSCRYRSKRTVGFTIILLRKCIILVVAQRIPLVQAWSGFLGHRYLCREVRYVYDEYICSHTEKTDGAAGTLTSDKLDQYEKYNYKQVE